MATGYHWRGATLVFAFGAGSILASLGVLHWAGYTALSVVIEAVGCLPAIAAAVTSFRRERFAAPISFFAAHAFVHLSLLNLMLMGTRPAGAPPLQSALVPGAAQAGIAVAVNSFFAVFWASRSDPATAESRTSRRRSLDSPT